MSSTTTTTKKPNDGPCVACNKEGAVLRCAPCLDAGVDVFFCNRDCQVRVWKMHKAVCKKTSNAALKKEHVDAKKAAKESPTIVCANCLKTDADNGFKLSKCSKCSFTYYCSRDCQVEDWPRHKLTCKCSFQFANNMGKSLDFDSTGLNICSLFHKWVMKTEMQPIYAAVYLALKKKGIKQQPPVKVALMEVEFNYNAQAFVVTEVPRAVAIDDLHKEQKEMVMEKWKDFKNKSVVGLDQEKYIQFAIVSTKELGPRFQTLLDVVFDKSIFDGKLDIVMHTLRFRCTQVRLKSDLFRGWKSILRNNLQKQIQQMNIGQSYNAFVQGALQFACNQSLQKTHRIIVGISMGKGIGQFSQLLDYTVMPIADYKKGKAEVEKFIIHLEDIESRPLPCTDIAVETLFIDPEMCFAFEYTVLCGVNGMRNKTAKQCKKAADKHFRKLQQSVKGMSSDLLETVSL